MGVLYDKLYRTENYKKVLVKEYLSQLIDEIVEMFPWNKKINIEKQMDNFTTGAKTIFPLGIIVNELITNAMKYAFTDRDTGTIKISVKKEDNYVIFIFEDDGIGISELEKKEGKGFGMTLIDMMIAQIGGSYKIENICGTKYIIGFEDPVKISL